MATAAPARLGQARSGNALQAKRIVLPALGLAALYAPVLVHAVGVWGSDPEFSFGFAAVPIAAAVVWLRRDAILASAGVPAAWGLPVMLLGLALYLASARSGIHALAGVSFLPAAGGAVAYLYGARTAGETALPFGLVAAGLSLFRGLLNSLGFQMQMMTAVAAAPLATWLGTPVRQAGVDLFTSKVHLVVAQACSGMDSLVAMLCLGGLIVGLGTGAWKSRAALLASVLPIILLANVIRVTLVLVLYPWLGPSITTSPLHEILDAVLFLVSGAVFLLVAQALRCGPAWRVTR